MANILISFGHTEDKPGAKGNSYTEYDFTKPWAERIYEIIKAKVDNTILVPEGGLKEKVEFINSNDPLFCVEVHFNANIPNAKGSETLHFPESTTGKWIAEKYQEEFEKRFIFQPNRGAKDGVYWSNGEIAGTLYLLRATRCPTVILEPEFMSNEDVIMNNENMGIDAIVQATLDVYKELS